MDPKKTGFESMNTIPTALIRQVRQEAGVTDAAPGGHDVMAGFLYWYYGSARRAD